MSNYRPISLITTLAKLMEKAVKTRFKKFIHKWNWISNQQSGFQGLWSNDAIEKLVSSPYNSMDPSEPTAVIFLNLAIVFDTVSHSQLLNGLEYAGIGGLPQKFVESYLTNWTQVVKINEEVSNKKNVLYGVPQGSVIGLILFNLYIYKIFSFKSSGKELGFADDSAVINAAMNWKDLESKIETDLNNIFQI